MPRLIRTAPIAATLPFTGALVVGIGVRRSQMNQRAVRRRPTNRPPPSRPSRNSPTKKL